MVVGNFTGTLCVLWFGLSASYAAAIASRAVGGALNAIILAEKAMIGGWGLLWRLGGGEEPAEKGLHVERALRALAAHDRPAPNQPTKLPHARACLPAPQARACQTRTRRPKPLD